MRWSAEEYKAYLEKQEKDKKKKVNKYRNEKVIVDDIKFDSRKEADYYQDLKLLKKAGKVKDFSLQPEFELQRPYKKNGKTIRGIYYVADFRVEYPDGRVEIVDTKGVETQVFKMKKKMLEFRYPDIDLKVI